MGNGSVSSAFLVILNIVYLVLGLGLTAASIWFFIEVQDITRLRNSHHYMLDYNVYWPQAIPWMFLIAGFFVVFNSACGFVGAKKESRPLTLVFITFQAITLILLIGGSILALVMADSKASDQFVADTVWDAFKNMKDDRSIESAFGVFERRYQCCGAAEPRDYKNWKYNFPRSCCDTYYHAWSTGEYQLDCDFTNKLANERLGCVEVAGWYARIAIKVFSGVAIVTAIVGILNLIAGLAFSKGLNQRRTPKVVVAQYEADSKKVLI